MRKRLAIKRVGAIFIATALLNATAWAQPKIKAEADSLNKYFSRLNAYHERFEKDQFTDMPSFDDLNGKPFRAEMGFKGNSGDSVSGPYSCGYYYLYKDGELMFTSGTAESNATFCIKRSQKHVGTYRGSNAYGVSASVQNTQVRVGKIAVLSPMPMLNVFESMTKAIAVPSPMLNEFEYKTIANRQLAKALVSDVILVFEGVLLSPGACESDHIQPTFTNPEEYSIQICQINVSINRVSYQRKSTGEILAEWPEGRSVE